MLLMRDASWALASERRVVTASATRLERCEKKRQAAPSAAFQTAGASVQLLGFRWMIRWC